MSMRFAIIGSSTPLQKTLPLFETHSNVSLLIFLDAENDSQAIKWCDKNQVQWHDAAVIKTDHGTALIDAFSPDWIFSINSTVIIPNGILKLAKKGALNLHPGKLPEYAGLHTHQWAIRNGETTFGVTIHHMLEGIDTGNIAYQTLFDLDGTETGLSLFLKCTAEGTKLFQIAIENIIANKPVPSIPQDTKTRKLYTHKMALHGEINFHQTTDEVLNFIRAANYEPFHSPAYKPTFEYHGQKWHLVKAHKGDLMLNSGECLWSENKLFIGTINGSIEVVKIKDISGTKIDLITLINEE